MADLREPHTIRPLPELSDGTVLLRTWDPTSDVDAEAWLRGLTDPEFLRWNTLLTAVENLAAARDTLLAREEDRRQGGSASFCIADADSGAVLGHMGVNDINPVMRNARVGYWVLPEARGRGAARRALTLATRWAFAELPLHRLELGHALGNGASCRVADRCGFPYEGTLRGAMFEAGRKDAFRDVHLHARLATDPEPADP
ncbi:GNAT family N-acetyltransferase [Streptomyces cavernae]|uniref:GNAT family N-acetyltransferase n=1 Tax=Streptomyces cavernae TaxID=2259034 RepID=UPI000FEBCAAC|nr:GNAT family protein [Streptomyces cavernae]